MWAAPGSSTVGSRIHGIRDEAAPLTRRVYAEALRDRLRDTADTNQLRADQRMPARVTSRCYCRRRFVERPARRFPSARDALQEHPILLELQQVIVAVQPAEHLAHALDDPEPFPLRLVCRRPDSIVRRDRMRVIRHHVSLLLLSASPISNDASDRIAVQVSSRGVPGTAAVT